MSFGGALLRLVKEDARGWLDLNGKYCQKLGLWFVEGWEEYLQPEEVESSVVVIGPAIVGCLGGLSDDELAMEFEEGFLGHPDALIACQAAKDLDALGEVTP